MNPLKSFRRRGPLLLALLLPAVAAQAQDRTVSLAGEWRFALDRADAGVKDAWYARDLADRIRLPGILQAQDYGDEISPTTPWVLTLGDAWWKLQPPALREHFSQPGHVEVPFLAQPPRHYLGAAWYQRDVDVPASWRDRPVTLFLERAHWETEVWIDETSYPTQDSLVAPHLFALGALAPGRHRLTIRVDNRQIIRDPAGDNHGVDSHSVSDSLGAAWNGIVGRIELRETPPVWIDDVEAFPEVATHAVRLHVRIRSLREGAGSGELSAGALAPLPVSWTGDGTETDLEVPLGAKAVPWDEFHPVLQHLTVTLHTDAGTDRRPVSFGLREISHDDKTLLINGAPVNLRLTHFGGDFPLTGYPATDQASWRRIFQVCKDYGLNGMRFHSWCPPEAAFAAADELGFYLQPECGMWSPFNPGSTYTRFLEIETARLLRAFGNHPSFILLSPSNEPSGHYQQVTPQWAAAWYEKDARRLYSAGTGWGDPAQVNGGAQYASLVRFGRGELRNVSGWFGRDYRAALAGVHIPVLAHEVGQWCAYPDFDVIAEFTGYLRPGNFDIFRYLAAQQGVLAEDHAFAWASGRFQLACYKEEIEANLRTPGLAGYQLLDLHDYLGQGTALIGVVDAFWKPKSYVTAQEFRRFNGDTVPLARLTQRVFTTADTLSAEVELYHFGAAPLAKAEPYWKIVDAAGSTMKEGRWPATGFAIGKNQVMGTVRAELAALPAPGAYKLVAGLKGTTAENDWNFWLYPARIEPAAPADVLETSDWAAAATRLAAGGKVFFTPRAADLNPGTCPPMKNVPVFWNIQMTVRPPRNPTPRFDAMLGLLCDKAHPALAEFPTEANCDWQWTPLIQDVRSINLDAAPRTLRPIVAAIDDWNRDWRLGVIFECRVGPGRLLVSAIDLAAPDATPGARQLRRSLLDYMGGAKFRPAAALTPDQARQLWPGPAATAAPASAPRSRDPDLDDGLGRPGSGRKF